MQTRSTVSGICFYSPSGYTTEYAFANMADDKCPEQPDTEYYQN